MLPSFMQDLRYALRRLARQPGFSALVVLTLGLGIGANAAIFSVVDAALLRPLPFQNPGQLLQLWETESAEGHFPLTGQDYLDWRAQNRTFSDLAVYSHQKSMNASGSGEPERVSVVETQSNFFSLIGVSPLLGRTFLAGEDQAGRNRVALLSYAFWQSHFGGRADAIGKATELNGAAYEIVGVMPAWYSIPASADLWVPIDMSPKSLGPRGEHHLRAVGRMKAGVTPDQAEADLKAIAARLEQQFPETNGKVSAVTASLKEALVGDLREQLYILLGAVALVLLIACANVANLLLARASARRREVAVRAAMGARRGRLIRQLLTESVLLSVLGGLAGVALAYGLVQVIVAAKALPVSAARPIAVNSSVLLFTLAVSVAVGILFGLAPALQASRGSVNEDLKSGGSLAATPSRPGRSLRDALVAAEIALSLMLLTGAGLLLRTFENLRGVDLGIHAEKVLAATVILPTEKYSSLDARWAFFERLLQGLGASPGVKSVALASELPLEGGNNGYITIDGQPEESTRSTLVEWNFITADYFRVMGIPLVEGREFTAADLAATGLFAEKAAASWTSGQPVAERPKFEVLTVINRTMARRFWPGQQVIGRVFHEDNVTFRVIGVVGDVKVWNLRRNTVPQAYFPFTLGLGGSGERLANVVAQSAGRPADVAGAIRSQFRTLDSSLAVARLRTYDQIVSDSMTDTSYQTLLLALFAGLALLLATLGIYGVMSYTVAQRTNEFGIRLALGADSWSLLRMVAKQGARLALLGALAGLAAALGLAGVLRQLLFGVEPTDPATLAIGTVLTMLVSLAACYLPARRAARVDPLVALRYE